MSNKGKSVEAALTQHADRVEVQNLHLVMKALTSRPLGEKHFKTVNEYVQSCRDASPIKIAEKYSDNPEATLDKRQLSFFLAYMCVTPVDTSLYVPSVYKMHFSQRLVTSNHRKLPLYIHSTHIEKRHIGRLAGVLQYDASSFKFATGFSLLLSRVMEKQIKNDTPMPIVIPQPLGMFLGKAELIDNREFYSEKTNTAIYDKTKSPPYQHVVREPEWIPSVDITMGTYIRNWNYLSEQSALHESLRPFYEDPAMKAALENMVECYAIGSSSALSPSEKRDIGSAVQTLTEITQGRPWREHARRTLESERRKKLAEEGETDPSEAPAVTPKPRKRPLGSSQPG